MKTFFKLLCFGMLLTGCSKDNTNSSENSSEDTLARFITGKEISESSVIACAGSALDPSQVNVYFYPRPGATDIRYFETQNSAADPNNFENYVALQPPMEGLFNGFLQFFRISPPNEKWVIITFEENGIVNISNPIRVKHLSQATEYAPENMSVSNTPGETMPQFNWMDGTFEDSVIYFQVVSTKEGTVLSATYTVERIFQYYVLDNVVLNITEAEPPNLELGVDYNVTLLSVTEDNWVNLFSEIPFRLE
ncbi:MAG: hypothetical protein ACFB0A_01360 [Croceivirga sp.]